MDDLEHNPRLVRREDGTYAVVFVFPDIDNLAIDESGQSFQQDNEISAQ